MSSFVPTNDINNNDNNDNISVASISAEEEHWNDVAKSLILYIDYMRKIISMRNARIQDLYKRSPDAARYIPSITHEKFDNIIHASSNNQDFFDETVRFFNDCDHLHYGPSNQQFPYIKKGDMITGKEHHRNQAILHSMYREWSIEGSEERASSFAVVIDELKLRLPIVPGTNEYKYRVLVPGCGLGRLPLEISGEGYSCMGNEFSAYMIMASQYILNGIHEKNMFDIYPWLDRVCNVVKIEDLFQRVKVPDQCATDILNKKFSSIESTDYPKFSMSSGDFIDIYSSDSQHGKWDAVITCFFIDTAPIIIEYMQIIYDLLPSNGSGYWINIGPLLYHWTSDEEGSNDARFSRSIELSWEEIEVILKTIGFEIVQVDWKECKYSNCTTSMMYTTYKACFFTALRPAMLCQLCN